jgi:ascorbate-specific PTS system EIIC-type component UlaA
LESALPLVDPPLLHNLNPWLTLIGFVITFLGIVITVYVLIEVKRIKSDFLARVRLPGLIKDLEKAGTALNSAFAECGDLDPTMFACIFGNIRLNTKLR